MGTGDGIPEPLACNNSFVKIRSFGKIGVNRIGNPSGKLGTIQKPSGRQVSIEITYDAREALEGGVALLQQPLRVNCMRHRFIVLNVAIGAWRNAGFSVFCMTKKQIRKNGILPKGNVDTLCILVNKGLKQGCSISLIPARNKNSVVHRHGRIKYIVPGKSPQLVTGKDAVFLKREINRTVRILVGNASRKEIKILINFANKRGNEIRANSIVWVKEADIVAGGNLYPSNIRC